MMQALQDGELSAGDADRALAHCSACAECEDLMRRSSQVRRMLALLTAPQRVAPMWPDIVERLDENAPSVTHYGFAVGASILAAAGLALGLLVGNLDASRPDLNGPEWQGSRPLADVYLANLDPAGGDVE